MRLIVFEIDEVSQAKSVKGIKEQDVYMGDIPLMTPNGTFLVNGTERVVVSQMHRSPGVFFDNDKGKTHSSGKILFTSRIIPYRGSWLDFEFDAKDLVYVRIDRRRKIPVSTLLFALGLSQEEICETYYQQVKYRLVEGNKWSTPFYPSRFRGVKPLFDLVDSKTGEVIAEAGKKITPRFVKEIEDSNSVKEILVPFESIIGRFASSDIINEKTGEIWLEAGEEITCDFDQKSGSITGGNLKTLFDNGVTEIQTLDIDHVNVGPYLRNTMVSDKNFNRQMALEDIYKVMRPGEPPTLEAAADLFESSFLTKKDMTCQLWEELN